MSHLIKIYAVCKFSYFRLWYLELNKRKACPDKNMHFCSHLETGEYAYIAIEQICQDIKKSGKFLVI